MTATDQTLLALWLAEHDDDTPDTYLTALSVPAPFLTDDVSEGDDL
jgi:hypothetical protein